MLGFASNREEQFKFRRQFVLGVKTIGEVNSANAAVCVNLNSQSFDVVCSVRSAGEVRQVELNLVPSFVESHRHRANERFYARCALVVGSSESASHVFVVQNLHFESEVFFELQGQSVKLTFLMIMTRKGSLIARVFLGSTGQVM